MNSNSQRGQTSSSEHVYQVPGLSSSEMNQIAELTFQRYSYSSSSMPKRRGNGVAIVWFRNDLRVLDNEALFRAWMSSEAVLPVYCVDPRLFCATHYFGFPKTGALRSQFLIECLADLKNNLMKCGLNLLIQHGKPEEILPSLVKAYGAHTVYAHKETCSEELKVESLVDQRLRKMVLQSAKGLSKNPSSSTYLAKLELIWGSTMYHLDDLPFDCSCLPDVYTQFRKHVESSSKIRGCIKLPMLLGPPPSIGDWGCVPAIEQIGHHLEKAGQKRNEVCGW
ncbi:unnamed protein product [Ilex paraguariensis]|uniref:Photolyase/cryptochrome alpha/beta domain-containing protein n=1 Tax=Ilex paraguariensis TaxID=185542 RepID=A0ABC8SD74_9AQUA